MRYTNECACLICGFGITVYDAMAYRGKCEVCSDKERILLPLMRSYHMNESNDQNKLNV